MRTTFVRSLIAGSFAAVASLTASLAVTPAPAVHASGVCLPIITPNGDGTVTVSWPDNCGASTPVWGLDPDIDFSDFVLPPVLGEPPVCTPLDPVNLTVLAAQTTPYDWQWRFRVEGDTSGLCDMPLYADMVNLDVPGQLDDETFTLYDILAANSLGSDFIVTLATWCHYATTVYYGAENTMFVQYADIERGTDDCAEAPIPAVPSGDPADPATPGDPAVPAGDPADPADPADPVVPGDTTTEVDAEMPHTGSDATAVMIGLGLLVVGAGLGFTALSISRRRTA